MKCSAERRQIYGRFFGIYAGFFYIFAGVMRADARKYLVYPRGTISVRERARARTREIQLDEKIHFDGQDPHAKARAAL